MCLLPPQAVYSDFALYSGGVYTRSDVARGPSGEHAVKLIGWGAETSSNGTTVPYWIAINSWGPDWGEAGSFRIRRGTDECGIELQTAAGTPLLPHLKLDDDVSHLGVPLVAGSFRTQDQGRGLLRSVGCNPLKHVGCYTNVNTSSTLAISRGVWSQNDWSFCASLCQQDTFVGVENGSSCYCGKVLGEGATPAPEAQCNVPCAGNSSEICGGSTVGGYGFISVFACGKVPPAPPPPACTVTNDLGCYTEHNGNSTLPIYRGSFSTMDRRFCTKLCRPDVSSKSAFMGIQNGTECWCGNALSKDSVPAPASECSVACPGNTSETCGGATATSVFQAECLTCCSRWCRLYGACTRCTQRCGRGRGRGRGGCCVHERVCCNQAGSCDQAC